MTLDIIYQDEHYIAINKPSGLLVHRSPIDRHETRFAIQMLRDQIGQRVYPVHRLDKPTSGILIFGLTQEAASKLHQNFSEACVKKDYMAICRGYTPEKIEIDHPVKAVLDKKDKSIKTEAKPAKTLLTTIDKTEIDEHVEKYPTSRYSLVHLQPFTGRRHQLRYHMKHISHPIIGDAKYGRGTHNRFFKDKFNSNRLLLAAVKLAFKHPYTEESIALNCKPTEDFKAITSHLNFEDTYKAYLEQLSEA